MHLFHFRGTFYKQNKSSISFSSEVLLMISLYPASFHFPPSLTCLSINLLVLNQLPLPSPLPATTAKSLLYNGRISEEVSNLLVCRDENLVTQLAHSLNQVSTEHM